MARNSAACDWLTRLADLHVFLNRVKMNHLPFVYNLDVDPSDCIGEEIEGSLVYKPELLVYNSVSFVVQPSHYQAIYLVCCFVFCLSSWWMSCSLWPAMSRRRYFALSRFRMSTLSHPLNFDLHDLLAISVQIERGHTCCQSDAKLRCEPRVNWQFMTTILTKPALLTARM